MNKNKKIVLIVGGILILILVGVLIWYFLGNEEDNTNNENKENNVNEVINPNKDVNDTRVYPLKIKFYEDLYEACFETVDGKCARVYTNNDGYQEEIYNDLDEDKLEGEYTCKTFECSAKGIDYEENLAFIIDDNVYVIDFNNNAVYDTEMTKDISASVISYLSVANNFGNENFDIIVYSENNHGNVYNTEEKKFLFGEWYDNSLMHPLLVLDEYFLTRDEYKNESYLMNRDDEILQTIGGNNYSGKTYKDKIVLTYNGTESKMSLVIDKDNLDEKVYLIGDGEANIVGDYIVSSDYTGYPDHQMAHVYNSDTLELIKSIDNALYLEQVSFDNKTFYIATVDIGRGGNNSTTQVLDSNFDVLIGPHSLPSDYKDYDEGYFTAHFNDLNNTIAIWLGNIYVYDLEGNLINTIDRDIIGLVGNYFVANENNSITLRDYDDNLITTFITIDDNFEVDDIGLDGYRANIGYNKYEDSFEVVIKDKTNNTCTMYSYSFVDKDVTQHESSCGWD